MYIAAPHAPHYHIRPFVNLKRTFFRFMSTLDTAEGILGIGDGSADHHDDEGVSVTAAGAIGHANGVDGVDGGKGGAGSPFRDLDDEEEVCVYGMCCAPENCWPRSIFFCWITDCWVLARCCVDVVECDCTGSLPRGRGPEHTSLHATMSH